MRVHRVGQIVDYRLYFLRADGRIGHAHVETMKGDGEVAAYAVGLDHAHSIEIWQEQRLVGLATPATGEFRAGVSGAA